MSLVDIDGMPLIPVGYAHRSFVPSVAALSSVVMDAALEATIMIGHICIRGGGSHTIDTTGASLIEWRSGSTTFVNAGTSVKIGLAAVDLGAGPRARAVNVADLITFDVSKTLTGSGIASNAWQSNVPDAGTKTIAHGDLVALGIQMVTRGGSDIVRPAVTVVLSSEPSLPTVTTFTGSAYGGLSAVPNAIITFSDGARGYFFGGNVASIGASTVNANSGTSLKEAGNVLQFPAPVRAYGAFGSWSLPVDMSVSLYSDPFGTPVAERTVNYDANAIGASAISNPAYPLFTTPYDIPANTPVVIAVKGGATNTGMNYKTYNSLIDQESEALGQKCYAVTRDTGAFAQQNSGKDRCTIGLLISAFDGGVAPRYGLGI